MENATKALLIAASVLVVIVIIALGIKLLNSSSNTSENAKNVGESISKQTEIAVASISDSNGLKEVLNAKTSNEFNNFFTKNNYIGENVQGQKVIELKDSVDKINEDGSHKIYMTLYISNRRNQ